MKLFISTFVYFSLCIQLFAQVDNLKEVFPLAVGNKWIYSFSIGAVSSGSHSSVRDSGIVKLEITAMLDSPDSIRWQFFQRREYYHNVYGIPASGWKKDSSSFELIEIKKGMHELYLVTFDKNAVFPYYKTSVDSEKIYRYVDSTSSDYFIKTRGKNNGYENDYYKFTMKVDTGIVISSRGLHSASSMWNWARYYLSEFNKYYIEPFLSIPQKTFSIVTLNGISKDTTITILNNGSQSLIISNVISSDINFSVVDYSNAIQPHSQGTIIVRFHPAITGNSTATLTISSNSLPSPNTITLEGTSYEKAILLIQPNNVINYEGTPNGKIRIGTYSITNLGNIDLIIDSISISNPVFKNHIKAVSITPGQTAIDTVSFSPLVTSEYSAELKLYSNSSSDPYTIWLYGISSEEINIELDIQSIYFGRVPPNETHDTTIVIKNNGKENVLLVTYIHNNDLNYPESPFIFIHSDNSYAIEIKPNSSYSEIIRFKPKNSDYISRSAGHDFYSINYSLKKNHEIKLEGNFTDYLNQNYPNPFNTTTKIKFQIGSKSLVRLNIYDILGREVYSLLDKELEPGIHEQIFNGNGLASGVYFYRLQAGSFIETKKFMLMK